MSRSLSAMAALLDHFPPPESVRGMKVLSREHFARHVVVPALVMPPKQCSSCLRRFKTVLLKQTGVKRLLGVSEGGEVRGRTSCYLLTQLLLGACVLDYQIICQHVLRFLV